jgi:hypothetical protein
MTRADIFVDDIIELNCPQLLHNTRLVLKDTKNGPVAIGKVLQVFDALHPDGSEGNLEIDLLIGYSWLRYKPNRDGGTITVLKRQIQGSND